MDRLINYYLWLQMTCGPCRSVSRYSRLQAVLPGFNSRRGQWSEFFSSPPRPDLYPGFYLIIKAAGA
jgi:hypothetical protein